MGVRVFLERYITYRHILVVGWVAFLFYCYPGYMSFDSGDQLEQARGLQLKTNWHPPVMAILWKLCDTIIAGPFLMLVIQSVTLLAGMFLILRRVMAPRAAAVATTLIMLSPPVICNMGVIWKDSQMAGFLILGTAFMMNRTRGWLVAGCVFLWLGTAQRHNAAAATLPVFLLLFVWNDEHAKWKRYGLAVTVWLGLSVSTALVNSWIADAKQDVFASLAMNDIVGVIKYHSAYTDAELLEDAPGLPWKIESDFVERARQMYSPTMTWLDLCGENGIFRYPKTPQESAAISAAWRRLILEHPGAYLRHRWKTFLAELRVIRRNNFYLWWGITDSAERATKLEHHARHTVVQEVWMGMQVALVDTPVYYAWVYFLIGMVLIWFLRRDINGLAVVLSGVLCEAGLFIAAPAIDYRYSHYMVTTTLIAAVYCVAMRRKAKRAPSDTER